MHKWVDFYFIQYLIFFLKKIASCWILNPKFPLLILSCESVSNSFEWVTHTIFQHHIYIYLLSHFFPPCCPSITFANIYIGRGIVKAMGWRIPESWNWEEVSTVLWCPREERWWSCLDAIQGTEGTGFHNVLSCKNRIYTEHTRRGW